MAATLADILNQPTIADVLGQAPSEQSPIRQAKRPPWELLFLLPAAYALTRTLRAYWRVMGDETIHQLRRNGWQGPVNLNQWVPTVTAAAQPHIERHLESGYKQLIKWVEQRRPPRIPIDIPPGHFETPPPRPPRPTATGPRGPGPLGPARRLEFVANDLTYRFCEATIRTTGMQASEAIRQFRRELIFGLRTGTALSRGPTRETGAMILGEIDYDALTARLNRIFNDPMRARRIARTEASRVVQRGRTIAARDLGAVNKTWIAFPGCCDRCEEMDGLTIDIDATFEVNSRAPEGYREVYHPPLHPNCRCILSYWDQDHT